MHVEAGQYIASQGERCDSIFVVLNGRLRTKTSKDDSRNQSKQEEFGRGATIGELEALSESQWTYSVYAVRHCEVARIPLSLFNIIMTLSPGAGIHFVST
jgi:lysophospholipid hydrolase